MDDYHVIIKTEGGKVSILRNLTKEMAKAAVKKLWDAQRPHQPPDGGLSYAREVENSDIVMAEILGPNP
jgi:hypothetical protein